MGSVDWTFLDNSLDPASVPRGVVTSPSPPPGGGSFIYGMNSIVDTDGAVGLTLDAATNPDFAPIQAGGGAPASVGGGSIRGAIARGISSLKVGFSPFFYMGLQAAGTPAVTDQAYIIGLEDSDPYRIVVIKGQIINGAVAATTENSLLRSTATYSIDSDPDENWHHIRMDMIVEGTGDVRLQCFESDLSAHDVTAPIWTPIPGCEEFVDDALGVNSGSLPFTEGYPGFAFASTQMGRRGYFDQIEIARQV